MTDGDVAEIAARFCAAQRIGESQVRVTHHAEHCSDAPVGHRLHEHVGNRALTFGLRRQCGIHAVVADFDRVGIRCVVERWRRGAVARRVVVAVPRAPQPATLDRALTERTTLMRAGVVERPEGVPHPGDAQTAPTDRDAGDPLVAEFVESEHPMPLVGPVGNVHGLGRRARLLFVHGGHVVSLSTPVGEVGTAPGIRHSRPRTARGN